MPTEIENISPDLLWQVTRGYNAYLVKRKASGGVQFSRDPLNLLNKHSRKYAGFLNDQAIGVSADSNTVAVTTKSSKHSSHPAQQHHTSSYSASTPTRKLYKGIVNSTAKKGYRSDLRSEAVARASAIRQSQRENKKDHEKKLRGSKAKKAES